MKTCNCETTSKVAWCLVMIGALNWLLVGLGIWLGGNWNVVNLIFGSWAWLEALIYVLVGLGAIYLLMGSKKMHGGNMGSPMMDETVDTDDM